MSVLSSTKPDAWTLSPQMTAAPELWQGCIAFFPFWENSGSAAKDIVNARSGTFTNSPTWAFGIHGIGIDFDNASFDSVDLDTAGPFENDAFTYMAYCRPIGVSDALVIYSKESGGPWSKMNIEDPNGVLRGTVSDSGGAINVDGTTNLFNKDVVVGFSYNGAGTSRIYVNGVNEGINTSLSGPATYTGELPRIGRRSSGEGTSTNFNNFNGLMYWVGIWNRELPEVQHRTLATHPFAMLRPAGF